MPHDHPDQSDEKDPIGTPQNSVKNFSFFHITGDARGMNSFVRYL